MTALSITAANVIAAGGANVENGVAGATITQGEVVYRDTSTSKFGLADCDSATANVRVAYGIALNGASDGQPLRVLKSGDITIGATLTIGAAYYLGATAGEIVPYADLVEDDYIVFLGVAKSASVLSVAINNTGAQAPAA
ncbi:hypothetical protein [Hoeflea sp.]|uniref:hypothetical protein n=1 Tax=Hoeflea sp. TaxID=1940281 RepID=UPI003B52AB10